MKKRLLKFAALGIVALLAFPLPNLVIRAEENTQQTESEAGNILTVTAKKLDEKHIEISGTCSETVVAIVVQIRDSKDQILAMESYPAGDGTYSGKMEISLTAGSYTVYVADYEGGDWKTAALTIEQSSDSTGGGGNTGGGNTGGGNPSGGATDSTKPSDDSNKENSNSATETKPDGTTVETSTETKEDGTRVETTTETKPDGSKTETIVETSKDGAVKTTETVTNTDGSATKTEKETETNAKGKEVAVTTTTKTDETGAVTSVTKKSVIAKSSSTTSTTVTVKKDAAGEITSASASVANTVKSGNKATVSAAVVAQIVEAAGTEDVKVTMTVKDSDGKTKFKLKVNAENLEPGEELFIYKLDTKIGKYTMVNAKTYEVNKNGNVAVSMSKKATYELVTAEDAEKISKEIKSTIKPQKASASVKKGKSTSFKLSSKVNEENIKSITYTTSKKSVATVNKSGKITTKGKGAVTITAKVILKNGVTKTIKMTIKVK